MGWKNYQPEPEAKDKRVPNPRCQVGLGWMHTPIYKTYIIKFVISLTLLFYYYTLAHLINDICYDRFILEVHKKLNSWLQSHFQIVLIYAYIIYTRERIQHLMQTPSQTDKIKESVQGICHSLRNLFFFSFFFFQEDFHNAPYTGAFHFLFINYCDTFINSLSFFLIHCL